MSESKPFDITLRWDKQQHSSIAKATDYPCVVGKGATREEALAPVKDGDSVEGLDCTPCTGPVGQVNSALAGT